MSEVKDWTKPVEVWSFGKWQLAEVLWRDERFPDSVLVTWGDKCDAVMCAPGELRNVPPPPPEVWVVWRWDGVKWSYCTTYINPVGKIRDGYYEQKVTCDAPLR